VKQIRSLCRHINNVQANCELLGERLIEMGEVELGKKLIANGFLHDNSKFFGIEYDYLGDDDPEVRDSRILAIQNHSATNQHHPEFWASDGGIHLMPRIALAEAICDWKARSSEFGTSLMDFIENQAMARYGFTKEDKVYSDIMDLVNLLVERPFTPLISELEEIKA